MATDYVTPSTPVALQPTEIIKPPVHCAEAIGVNRWDSWNGFLVRCPTATGCTANTGGDVFFNALSFFFTMRPRNAALALWGFAVLVVAAMYTADHANLPSKRRSFWEALLGLVW